MKQSSLDKRSLTAVMLVALICSQAIICTPRTQKHVNKCYIIEWFMGTIVEWYEYCALLEAVGRLRILRKSAENLR